MMASMVRVFPDPDSPTTPSSSPGERLKPTPSTARTIPAAVGSSTERFSTSSSAIAVWPSSLELGVERIAQAIADKVESHDGEQNHEARKGDDPPCAQHEFTRIRQHGAPFG